MASYLRKCVSMGASGVIAPGINNQWDMRYESHLYANPPQDHAWFFSDTATGWVKIWCDLLTLWPDSGLNTTLLGALDQQIAYARAWGLKPILTFHRYPRWINGATGDESGTLKKDYFRIPVDASINGAWAYVLWYFASRYSPLNPNRPYYGYSYIEALEPFNEPNGANWPQPGIGTHVADMMRTAKEVMGYVYNTPVLAGPGTAQTETDSASYTNFNTFTSDVLARLQANGFYGLGNDQVFVWSHHNYKDIETNVVNGVGVVREALSAGGWKGWPYPQGQAVYPPFMFVTEGGARVDHVGSEQTQADRWSSGWDRLKNDTSGAGVGLATQYLYYTASDFDSGLLRPTPVYPRPVYGTWRSFPKQV